jgi:ABC-2 type transport system permease protein
VRFLTATAAREPARNFSAAAGRIGALATIGYRRYATYRQATIASLATNTMFGFLRSYVLLAVLGATAAAGAASSGAAGPSVAGYSGPQLLTFVWLGQGLIGVVMLWGWQDLADRIRSGDVVMDLLRPQHPVITYLGQDFGRAAYAVLIRFAPPIVIGAIFFHLWLPQRPWTYPLGVLSIVLGVVISFGCRFLVNACSYWLLDNNGPLLVWTLGSGILGGLYFPLRFLPAWAMWTLWLGTPFPSILQAPLDVLTERGGTPGAGAIVGIQAVWVVVLMAGCVSVQRRAERKLVVQGG